MNITVEQLENLLKQQKAECAFHSEKLFNNSEFKKELLKLDPNEKIINKFHEIRDSITGAQFPNEFEIIKKYSL